MKSGPLRQVLAKVVNELCARIRCSGEFEKSRFTPPSEDSRRQRRSPETPLARRVDLVASLVERLSASIRRAASSTAVAGGWLVCTARLAATRASCSRSCLRFLACSASLRLRTSRGSVRRFASETKALSLPFPQKFPASQPALARWSLPCLLLRPVAPVPQGFPARSE
jgi:hypothetical protein